MGLLDKVKKTKESFKFRLGDEVTDVITDLTGIIVTRSQWLNSCNTYRVQPRELKDSKPVEPSHFDEPQLTLVKKSVVTENRSTGGPSKDIQLSNR